MMRHGDGTPGNLEEITRLQKVVRVCFWNIRIGVMQLMRATEVGVRDHAGNQRDPSPPKVCHFRAAQMTVDAFMGHNGSDKDEVRSEKYVERSEERRVGKECRSRWSPY